MKQNLTKLWSKFDDLLLAWFPCLVAFLLIPFSIYLPNQNEFDFNLIVVMPYIFLAVAGFIFLFGLLSFKPSLRSKIAVTLFFLGVYLALSDTLAPVQMGELIDPFLSEPMPEPLGLSILDFGLAVLIIYCAVKLPTVMVKKVGVIIVLTLFLTEIVVIGRGLSFESHLEDQEIETIPAPKTLNESGNIYHITFDGFSGHGFLDHLNEVSSLEEFDGFIFFEKNRSNYLYTWLSVASFMTGSLYQDGSLEQWIDVWHSGGLINNLHEKGYEVSQYINGRNWAHKTASHVTVSGQFRRDYHDEIYHFADLWLLRMVPHYLHQEVYSNNSGLISRFLAKWTPTTKLYTLPLGSVEMMRELIIETEVRPDNGQYVYAHLYFPHGPHVMTSDCIYSPGGGYQAQARCAIKLMQEFITKLKQQGKYHQALIIFQSDHGAGSIGSKDSSQFTIPLEISKKITEEMNFLGYGVEKISNLSNSLLLIKPPYHSGDPLVISDRLTQLADIPATIYNSKNINITTEMGRAVLNDEFPENREVHTYLGFSQKNEKGLNVRFGLNIFKGEMGHLSYGVSEGWKIYPNISVSW